MPSTRRAGSRAPQPPDPNDLPELDLDEVGPAPSSQERPRDPARVAAAILLARAIPAGGTLSGVVVLEPWSAPWSGLLADVWVVLARPGSDLATDLLPRAGVPPPTGRWHVVSREAGDRRRDDTADDDEAADALWRGHSVLGVSSAPGRHLPHALTRAADRSLAVDPLQPNDLREVAGIVTGDTPSLALSVAACAAVSPSMLRLARRPGQSADDYLRRIAALADTVDATPDTPVLTLDKLHGMDEAVRWGRDLAADLASYRSGRLEWSAVDRGALLVGAPGTGKTTFARALAHSCGVPLVSASYAKWQAARQGHLGDLLRAYPQSLGLQGADTFDEARKAAPYVLFIDELDSFFSRTGDTRHRDWWTSVVNALLEHLDGVERREGVVVVGATNHPDLVDPAIVRSGRLDRTVHIALPDQAALAGMLRVHLGQDLAGADLMPVALHAAGATGADCERWVRGAKRRARRASREVVIADLLAEVGGSEECRPRELRRIVAVHEAGHALMLALEEPGALRHVSIVRPPQPSGSREGSHGEVAGALVDAPLDERALGAVLRRLLAGRAAEHVVFAHLTAGSGGSTGSDLARATRVALAAETALGFSERPLLWRGLWDGDAVGPLLLGDRHLAERVNARLEAAWSEVCEMLRAHRAALDEMAGRLLARGALSGPEVEAIVASCEAG